MNKGQQVDFSKTVKEVETESKKCESCGGTLVFEPNTQTLRCEHCGNTIKIDKDFAVLEHDIEEGFKSAKKWSSDEQATYRCESCGAIVVIDKDEEANLCPFCGASHVVKDNAFKGIKPHVVIPFQFGKDNAERCAKRWAKKRLFAPRKFKKSLDAENINGVYEPCFTFDSKSTSYYEGRVGEHRTRTVGSGKNQRVETYTVWKNISGVINMDFDDVLIASNERFSQKDLNRLSPFSQEYYCVYERKYLSGFYADSYQKELKDCWGDAKTVMDERIKRAIKNRYNYDVVDYLNVSTSHEDVKFKYLLLPIYRLNFHYKSADYSVKINGSSGKTIGKTPTSPLRVILAVLLGIVVVGAFIYFGYNYF